MMHEEKEVKVQGCTPEYCIKPEVNNNYPEVPGSEEEIRIINNLMHKNTAHHNPGTSEKK